MGLFTGIQGFKRHHRGGGAETHRKVKNCRRNMNVECTRSFTSKEIHLFNGSGLYDGHDQVTILLLNKQYNQTSLNNHKKSICQILQCSRTDK